MKTLGLTILLSAALIGSALAAPVEPATSCDTAVQVGDIAKTNTIVDVAKSAGMFNTLLKAATEAGLVETLSSKGPYTLFAPTDEAFNKLPKGALEALIADKAKLKAVLLYHVVPGNLDAAAVTKSKMLTSAEGHELTIASSGDKVMIDKAHVVKANIKADNGVIHVIDTVLMPK